MEKYLRLQDGQGREGWPTPCFWCKCLSRASAWGFL